MLALWEYFWSESDWAGVVSSMRFRNILCINKMKVAPDGVQAYSLYGLTDLEAIHTMRIGSIEVE